jgi:hypothetical protein
MFGFIKNIYDKVDNPGFPKEDLCGVFFWKGKAYSTNNHIIGRIVTKKAFPTDELLFWSYCKDESHEKKQSLPKINALKNLPENFVESLDTVFDSYTENYFFVKRDTLLSAIPKQFKSDAIKAKTFVHIKIEKINLKFLFFNKKGKILANAEIPILTANGKTTRIMHGSSFSVNLLYLFRITFHSFFGCDIIGFKLKGDNYLHPVIIFNKHNGLERPRIHWSIAQTILKIK